MSNGLIGFIGLGTMGSPMASRLIEAGHSLVVFDAREDATAALVERGATRASSPREVADEAEIVLVSLPAPEIVRDVAIGEGGLVHGAKVRTFVDLSTTGPRIATLVADRLARDNVAAIDAPVSGGVTGARKGSLTVMVSGPKAAFAAVEDLLKVLGRLFFIGEKAGMGQTMKLANNLIAATSLAVTCEAAVMGEKAGLDLKTMIEVLNVSSGRSSASDDKFPRAILPRSYDFGFTTGLSYKDVRLCLEEAEGLGVPMAVGSATRQLLVTTASLFGSDSDFTSMMKSVEHLAGIGPTS
jgi:3-hydroxyisobutyrate dehydrogenase-like beta-hydroxyacid dehydrogenase